MGKMRDDALVFFIWSIKLRICGKYWFSVFCFLKVFDVIKKQEETKQAELAAKVAEFKQIQAQHEIVSGSWI